jgi:hypothetical protein
MDNTYIATKAVNLSYGNNPYLEKILVKRLNEPDHRPHIPPLLCKINCSNERNQLRNELAQQTRESQGYAIKLLSECNPESLTLSERNRVVILWLMNSLLEEKLKDREQLESANRWKVINGVAAIVIPLFVVVIQYVLQRYMGQK